MIPLNVLPEDQGLENLLKFFSEKDRIYIEGFHSPKKRVTALGGRAILRYVTRKHGIEHFHLSYGKNGKPFFSDVSDCYFNISHSNGYLILAWSHKEIGIDIERIRNELPKFPERMLSPTDLSFLKKHSGKEQISCFFELWTRKESFTKLQGDSIFRNAKKFSVSNGEEFLPSMGLPTAYFHTCQWNDYMISVCTLEENASFSIEIVTLQEIIP